MSYNHEKKTRNEIRLQMLNQYEGKTENPDRTIGSRSAPTPFDYGGSRNQHSSFFRSINLINVIIINIRLWLWKEDS